MNEYTRKRQQRGQQQVRQLSIAVTLITALIVFICQKYKVVFPTALSSIFHSIFQMISIQWLSLIAVSAISASIGYILGRKQIPMTTHRVYIEVMATLVLIQVLRRNIDGDFKSHFGNLEPKNKRQKRRLWFSSN
ncbi:hypothetical protein [Planktothrix sp. FACHB-1365]|uniref:hypothetical protein n=1 Tax=Planktothrix sp. FACHB-1365 TaxID=2692855 RepID=UPI0016856B53|nr:hypothetical protein [Planktothrix sp. FACHB-1365]MBD2483976.1 hypothetical protein [Planktothrix sp. FACHB-1365]